MRFESTASMAPLYFGPYGRVHLLERLRPPAISEHSGDILRPGWSKDRRRLEQHPLGSILDHQAGAGLPMPALANCLGQDDLSLGRHGRRQWFSGCHQWALVWTVRPR